MALAMALMGVAMPGMVLGNVATYVPLLLGLVLLLAALGARGWRESARRAVESPLACVVVVLLAVLLAGSLTGLNPSYSVRHWKVLGLVAGIGFLLWHGMRQLTPEQGGRLWRWLAFGTLASFAVVLVIALGEPWFLKMGLYTLEDAWTQMRLRFFSSVLAVILPFCWVWWLRDGEGRLRLQWRGLALCGLSVVMVVVCAGRAGWLGVAASGLVCAWMLWRHHGLKLAPVKLAVTALVTLPAAGLAYALIYGLDSIKERVGVTVPERGLGGGRLDIWELAWAHMFDKPVFGIGVNGFRFLPGADYHPHNFLLQLGLEGGMLGLGLGLALLGLLLWQAFRRGRDSVMAAAAFAGLAGFAVCALTNKSIFNPEWLLFLAVLAALAAVRVPAFRR